MFVQILKNDPLKWHDELRKNIEHQIIVVSKLYFAGKMRSEVWKIKQIRYAYPVIVAKVFIFGTFFDLKSKKSTSFKDMARINFLVSSFLYLDWTQENMYLKKIRIWTLFTQCSIEKWLLLSRSLFKDMNVEKEKFKTIKEFLPNQA